jgi:hypothetical protein
VARKIASAVEMFLNHRDLSVQDADVVAAARGRAEALRRGWRRSTKRPGKA